MLWAENPPGPSLYDLPNVLFASEYPQRYLQGADLSFFLGQGSFSILQAGKNSNMKTVKAETPRKGKHLANRTCIYFSNGSQFPSHVLHWRLFLADVDI